MKKHQIFKYPNNPKIKTACAMRAVYRVLRKIITVGFQIDIIKTFYTIILYFCFLDTTL